MNCEICGMESLGDRCQEHAKKTNFSVAAVANSKQVGGSHYQRGGEQHWDRIWRLYGRGYFVGCATKYLERYHLKNGVEDLKKAQHFIQKLIELEQDQKLREYQSLPNPYTEGKS